MTIVKINSEYSVQKLVFLLYLDYRKTAKGVDTTVFLELSNSQDLESIHDFNSFVENAQARGTDMEINGLLHEHWDEDDEESLGAFIQSMQADGILYVSEDKEFEEHVKRYETEGFDVTSAIRAWTDGYLESLQQD